MLWRICQDTNWRPPPTPLFFSGTSGEKSETTGIMTYAAAKAKINNNYKTDHATAKNDFNAKRNIASLSANVNGKDRASAVTGASTASTADGGWQLRFVRSRSSPSADMVRSLRPGTTHLVMPSANLSGDCRTEKLLSALARGDVWIVPRGWLHRCCT